ncbi:recombinase family protein [Cryobacterium sp. CG_9.6]|uniref:recombinase family protein n=1 Tax=Cryobacterium sp. CG_9.6 TaxID=2760710 RepID=UPI002473954B|nr:recombinase family protein [Cryobacterium sp. CG_9.6]MDH6238509.1 DNA invertase Pin-like site-specific DNA recombinase [Cryobacterium sp. CG_9.6]
MPIGYGRVSTRDQHPEAQHDALTGAGCEQVFLDTASETLAGRPELDKALLSANRAGDQIVVTKLDRLGRSLENLIELSNTLQARGVDLVILDQGIPAVDEFRTRIRRYQAVAYTHFQRHGVPTV